MKFFVSIMTLAILSFGALALAQPPAAGDEDTLSGTACIQAGVATLVGLDLVVTAAQKDFVPGASLGAIIQLHRTNPGLFDGDPEDFGGWCAVGD